MGQWIKIIATVYISSSGKAILNAHSIEMITNFDDLTNGLLETIYNHELNKMKSNMNNHADKEEKEDVKMNDNPNNDKPWKNTIMKPKDAVKTVIKTLAPFVDEGISLNQINTELAHLDVNDIRNAITDLTENGYIYSTYDDDHFKYIGTM